MAPVTFAKTRLDFRSKLLAVDETILIVRGFTTFGVITFFLKAKR